MGFILVKCTDANTFTILTFKRLYNIHIFTNIRYAHL